MPKVKVCVSNLMTSKGKFYIGDELELSDTEISEINKLNEDALTKIAPKKKATK